MAGGWRVGPQWGNAQDIGSVTSGNTGLTTVATGASTFTPGAWTQAVASTSANSSWLMMEITKSYGAPVTFSVDIGIGASGSEVMIVQGLIVNSYPNLACCYVFPLSLPSGTRVAVRCASSTAYNGVYYRLCLFADHAFATPPAGVIDTYGFTQSTCLGTLVDPGTTANTKGAYAQLTASTTNNLTGFLLAFDVQGRSSGSASNDFMFDVAIGASGSEQIIVPNYWNFLTSSGQTWFMPVSIYFPIPIPAGNRIAIRAQSTYTGSDRTAGVTLYGVRQ